MNILPSFPPVRVVDGHAGEVRSVRTADDVWKTLLDDWPLSEGDCFLSALLVCIDVQCGMRAPEDARAAFVAAAVEAGVPLLS